MANYKSYTDRELVRLMQTGQESALVEIYERYWERMLGVAFNRLGNLEDAEECVQDVLYKLWNLREDWSLQHVRLENYLARAIRNQSFNLLDRRYRKRKKEAGFVPPPATGPISPEQQMILRELEKQIDQSVRALPPQCQLVFTLSRKEGLSNKEIAEKLNLSENTVRSHLKKAYRDLRNETGLTIVLMSFLFFR